MKLKEFSLFRIAFKCYAALATFAGLLILYVNLSTALPIAVHLGILIPSFALFITAFVFWLGSSTLE